MLLSELLNHFESIWPSSAAEAWDRPGLMLGAPGNSVSRVLLTVDVTSEVIAEAADLGCQLIVSHHPMYLRGVTELGESRLKGQLTAAAIRSNLAVFSAHTNADFQPHGVTNTLARALGLGKLRPMNEFGHGAIGELESPESLLEFARRVSRALPPVAQGVKVSGDPGKEINTVAVLAGAGDSYLDSVQLSGADVYVTSDLRHHPAQDFTEQSKLTSGPALIDISHWAAEWLWLDVASGQLSEAFPELEVIVSELKTDPWTFVVMQ